MFGMWVQVLTFNWYLICLARDINCKSKGNDFSPKQALLITINKKKSTQIVGAVDLMLPYLPLLYKSWVIIQDYTNLGPFMETMANKT